MSLNQWMLTGASMIVIFTAAAVALILILSRQNREEEAPKDQMLLLLWNERNSFLLQIPVGEQLVLGRENLYQYLPAPATVPMDNAISRAHISLSAHGGQIWMWNLSRINPVQVNGRHLEDGYPIAQGDRIRLGNSSFTVIKIE